MNKELIEILQEKLPFAIKNLLCVGELTLVLIDDGKVHHRGDKTLNRNIYAFGADGDLRWQIQEIPGAKNDSVPYVNIREEGGAVYAYNWCGVDYQLNLLNGYVQASGSGRPW
jgi:hypothetical protein